MIQTSDTRLGGGCQSMDYKPMKRPAFTLDFGCRWILLDDEMVEAAGVIRAFRIENAQLIDSANACNVLKSLSNLTTYKSRTN